jgi:FtsP/CotA-like multicopper oxidase with cupredoxin domain
MKTIKLMFAAALLLLAPALLAQQIQCLPQGQDLPTVPELQAVKNVLKGTIVVSAEQERMTFRTPATAPTPASGTQCYPQWVRVFRGLNTVPPMPPMSGPYGDPMPGPTLRARIGDLINLTLLNQIDPGKFPYSMDRGDLNSGCDQSASYPGTLDTYPDCFHGSSTANIHFHGTHTNPNSTGDNVFIEIRPSPRTKDAANAPLVTPGTVKAPFDQFFADCATHLTPDMPLSQWPYKWSDLPKSWTDTQEALLMQYDSNPNLSPSKRLWPVNAAQIAQGAWPQYYIGAYPYCFRIPQYTQTTWPPTATAASSSSTAAAAPAPAPAPAPAATDTAHTIHPPAGTAGAGTAEIPGEEPLRPLVMGQSPGTHWYHAHKHGSTAINVANGMTGVFILEGPYDDDLNAFYGKSWTAGAKVMVINQLGVTPNLVRGGGGAGQGPDKGPDFSVNGRLKPTIQMKPGEVQMWRIVNTTGRAGTQFAAPTNGVQWKQLAQDGVQFNDANYQSALNQSFLLMSGNRADLLVKAPTKAGTYPILVQNMVDPRDLPTASPLTLVTITVSGTAATGNAAQFIPTAPAFPPFLADITDQEITGTKRIVFASTNPPAQHTIDGKKFDGEVGEVVLLNTVEEWKVSNATTNAIAHPFHIHINPFQVTEVFDPNALLTDANGKPVNDPVTKKQANQYVFVAPTPTTPLLTGQCYIDPNGNPDDWKPCGPKPAGSPIWWDVFPIPSAATATNSAGTSVVIPGYFKMRSRFVDYSGYYVIHCHILAHEDRGMMTIVQVAPYRSPYSHH